MLKAVLCGSLVAGSLLVGHGAHADQKSDDVRTLLDMTGFNLAGLERSVDAQVKVTLQTFIDRHPDMTGAQAVALQTQALGVENQFLDAMRAEVASFYYTHMSDEDIRAVIVFYETPEGRAYRAAGLGVGRDLMMSIRQRLPVLSEAIREILLQSLKGHSLAPQFTGPERG